jgi:hypothetical protein
LSCPGLNGSYECEIIDWEYKVSGLNHSGVKELDFKMTFTARELDPIVFILAGGSNMYGVSSADGLSNKSLLDIPENVDFYYAEQDVGGLVLANSFGEQHYSDGGYHHFGPEVSLINGLSTLYSTRKVVVLKFADFDSGISEWNSDLRDALVDYVNEMTSNYDDFEYGDIFWMQGGSDAIDFEDDYYFLSKSFFEYVNFELGEDLRVFMIQVPSEDNNCLWGELSYDDSKNIDKIWLWQYLLGTSISNLNVFSDDELSCFSNDGVCFDLGRNIFNWYANFNGQNIEIGLIDFGLIDDSAEANCDNYFVSNCWCASDGFGNLLFIDHNVDSKSGCLELCNYTNGVGCCQWSDTGEFCMGFTEKDGFTCDDSLDDYAALSCEDACVDDLWMPSSSSYCNDETFVQTSNCGSTRTVYGNVNCEDDFTVGEDCYASYYEKLGPEYWDPYNMDTDEWCSSASGWHTDHWVEGDFLMVNCYADGEINSDGVCCNTDGQYCDDDIYMFCPFGNYIKFENYSLDPETNPDLCPEDQKYISHFVENGYLYVKCSEDYWTNSENGVCPPGLTRYIQG